MQQQNTNKGFTLIELMIVVAIVTILAGISIPLYQNYMIKARRADAKAALSELSVWMERYYTAKSCYTTVDSNGDCTASTAPALPFNVAPKSAYNPSIPVPANNPAAFYGLTVVTTATSFTLTATPLSKQPDTKCGALSLNNTNVKSAAYGTVAECW